MKSRNQLRFGIALILFSIAGVGNFFRKSMNTKLASDPVYPLRVFFPFSSLGAKERLIDPSNLETISEYYLLENLGLGLLRDDPEQIEEYKPGYALNWKQIDSKTWNFELVPHQKWSDGSPILGEDWVSHFNILKSNTSRHLIHLHNLERVDYLPVSNSLSLRFTHPTSNTILHELSLSDAVLVSSRNLKGDWRVTSGAYAIKNIDWTKKTISLAINRDSPAASSESPQFVELFSVQNFDEIGNLFQKTRTDIYLQPTPLFDPAYKKAEKNASKKVIGASTLISFFHFGKSNPLTKNIKVRREFRTLLKQALSGKKFGAAQLEDQLIPFGYAGRLPKLELPQSEIKELQGKTLTIALLRGYKSLPEFEDILKAAAFKHSIQLKFVYGTFSQIENANELFAALSVFKGNQKDAIGSFSFLFSENGQLGPFRSEVISELTRITSTTDVNLRNEAIKKLHKRILENAYAIPISIEPNQVLISKQIDLSKWNPFDMRLRIYDVRIK